MESLNENNLTVKLESERTPGSSGGLPGVAVSGTTGKGTGTVPWSRVPSQIYPKYLPTNSGGGGGVPSFSKQDKEDSQGNISYVHTVALPPTLTTEKSESDGESPQAVVVGFSKLQQLLSPAHPYFRDKQAHIVGFNCCVREDEQDCEQAPLFLYPIVGGDSQRATRLNPYRRYRLARSHTGRTLSELENWAISNNIEEARLASVVLTVPAEVSLQLSRRKTGKSFVWNCYRRFFRALSGVLGIDGQLASLANLHVWRKEQPLNPHFHIHCLIPSYFIAGVSWEYGDSEPRFEQWFGKGILKEYTDREGRKHRGYVPFSDIQLVMVKQLWTDIVKKACQRNGIKSTYLAGDGLLDVYCDFVSLDDKARVAHRINYQKRSWIEDYALYTLDNPDCDYPPEWLEGYENRARPFGWWCYLGELGGVAGKEVKTKLDSLTGVPLIYKGKRYSLDGLELWSLENYKGGVQTSQLSGDALAWLRSVYPGGFNGT